MAELKEPQKPFYQRVEYPKDDPLTLLYEQGHSYLPVFTQAKMEVDDTYQACRLQNCIRLKDNSGSLIVLLAMSSDMQYTNMLTIHEEMKKVLENPNFNLEYADIAIGEQGQGCLARTQEWSSVPLHLDCLWSITEARSTTCESAGATVSAAWDVMGVIYKGLIHDNVGIHMYCGVLKIVHGCRNTTRSIQDCF